MSHDSKTIHFHSRFMTLPTRVLRAVACGDLSPIGMAVLGALSSHVSEGADADDWVYPSLLRIGEMVGKSESTAQRVMAELISLGFVERRLCGRPGGGRGRGRTLYRVVFDPPRREEQAGGEYVAGDETSGDQNPEMGEEDIPDQNPYLGFERGAQNPKRELKTQNRGSKPMQGGSEIGNRKNNARADARARGAGPVPSGDDGRAGSAPVQGARVGVVCRELSHFLGEAEIEAGPVVVSKWLAGAGWQDGCLLVRSALVRDRVLLEFPRTLAAEGERLGLDGSVRVIVVGEA